MSAKSVRKGKVWERTVARDLTERTGNEHKRVLSEARDGNCGDVRGKRLVVQCKAGARPDVYGAVREAEEAAGGLYAVAAIHRTGRGGEKMAVMPWSHFLDLMEELGW